MPTDQSSSAVPRDTHCEFCGLDYGDAEMPEKAAGRRETPPAAHAKPVAFDDDGIPLFTHCEYCGVEYPAPRAKRPPRDKDVS